MHLSTTGWIIFIIFIVFIVSLNLNLIFAMRKKPQKGHWTDQVKNATHTMTHPWDDENERFQELAKKVEDIQSAKKDPNDGQSE